MNLGSKRRVPVNILREQYPGEFIEAAPEPYGPNNPVSRAVARLVMEGDSERCEECSQPATFRPKNWQLKVLVTVVDNKGAWVENKVYFPPECYYRAGEPYGPLYTMSPQEGVDAGQIPPVNGRPTADFTEEATSGTLCR